MNDPITKALDACKYINSQTRAFLEEVETIRAALQAPTQPQGDQEHRGQAGDDDVLAAFFKQSALNSDAQLTDEPESGDWSEWFKSTYVTGAKDLMAFLKTRTPPQTGEFVLVPRIPTDEMLKAGRDYFNECQDNAGYQAMIKAAPKQPPEVAPDNRKFTKLSDRKPLSCNPPDTKYEVLVDGKPVAKPNYAYWDAEQNVFCWDDYYLAQREHDIEWRLYQEEHPAPDKCKWHKYGNMDQSRPRRCMDCGFSEWDEGKEALDEILTAAHKRLKHPAPTSVDLESLKRETCKEMLSDNDKSGHKDSDAWVIERTIDHLHAKGLIG